MTTIGLELEVMVANLIQIAIMVTYVVSVLTLVMLIYFKRLVDPT